MSMPAVHFPSGISYPDFLATIDEGSHAEWVDGEVVPVTPPSEEHARISLFLAKILSGYTKRKGLGGKVRHAPFQMKLRRSGREPDVIYVAPAGLHRIQPLFLDGPADLAIEVVSPESRTRDRRDKLAEYAEAGVGEYWIIDPMRKTAEVYRLAAGGGYEQVAAGDPPLLRSEVIAGLYIDPAWLWMDEPDEWMAYEEWGLI